MTLLHSIGSRVFPLALRHGLAPQRVMAIGIGEDAGECGQYSPADSQASVLSRFYDLKHYVAARPQHIDFA